MIAFLLEEVAKGSGESGRGGGFGIVIVVAAFYFFLVWLFGPNKDK